MIQFKFSHLCAMTLMTAATVATLSDQAQAQDTHFLYEGESTSYEVYLLSGQSIYATCDENCFDIDLFLYDSTGAVVGADEATDAQPVIVAPYEGSFLVEMYMSSCATTEGCAAWLAYD
ncbi:hypothetical protein [Leptothoe sp. PORK10 BA2]|uniref:hypothetical protein n=1 Tax=Leptothoe sp. PORK10 BA2 TaxID=3110254 RepID=UPI002B1EA219|nr:hypothetical protein [Leptothoe sp. PORK10 BA2]MEA5465710.1 hypothetical protein [Leptothoe sp. PORK10 BA2]